MGIEYRRLKERLSIVRRRWRAWRELVLIESKQRWRRISEDAEVILGIRTIWDTGRFIASFVEGIPISSKHGGGDIFASRNRMRRSRLICHLALLTPP
jgi:hypothetical protein